MKTTEASLIGKIPAYAELQRQIHDALRAQHPEWIQANGDSPTCDAYDFRFAELLRIFAQTEGDKNCVKVRKIGREVGRAVAQTVGAHLQPEQCALA